MRSPLRSPAQVEGPQGVLPQPEKDLERPSSTRLEARFPYCRQGRQAVAPDLHYGCLGTFPLLSRGVLLLLHGHPLSLCVDNRSDVVSFQPASRGGHRGRSCRAHPAVQPLSARRLCSQCSGKGAPRPHGSSAGSSAAVALWNTATTNCPVGRSQPAQSPPGNGPSSRILSSGVCELPYPRHWGLCLAAGRPPSPADLSTATPPCFRRPRAPLLARRSEPQRADLEPSGSDTRVLRHRPYESFRRPQGHPLLSVMAPGWPHFMRGVLHR